VPVMLGFAPFNYVHIAMLQGPKRQELAGDFA
jgi:hypothetical protein